MTITIQSLAKEIVANGDKHVDMIAALEIDVGHYPAVQAGVLHMACNTAINQAMSNTRNDNFYQPCVKPTHLNPPMISGEDEERLDNLEAKEILTTWYTVSSKKRLEDCTEDDLWQEWQHYKKKAVGWTRKEKFFHRLYKEAKGTGKLLGKLKTNEQMAKLCDDFNNGDGK